MSLAATIDAMIAAGCTPEQIGAVARAHEDQANAQAEAKRAARRAGNAERQRRSRANRHACHAVTGCDVALQAVTERDKEDPHTPKENSPSPSPPKGGSVVSPGGGPTTARGHRLPDDWRPAEDTIGKAEAMGLSRREILGEILAEFGDFWRSIPGARGRRVGWDGTFLNRCREVRSRRTRDGPRHRGNRTVADMAAMNLDHDPDFFDGPGSCAPDAQHGAATGAQAADAGRSGFAGRLPFEAAGRTGGGSIIDH